MRKAKVYLVGAGPGDPGLITVKGKECIETAEVVIYDYLAAPALLNHAPENAEIIYVGKKGGDHTLSQDEINALIVEKPKPDSGFVGSKAVIRLSLAAVVKKLKCWWPKAYLLRWCPG